MGNQQVKEEIQMVKDNRDNDHYVVSVASLSVVSVVVFVIVLIKLRKLCTNWMQKKVQNELAEIIVKDKQ